MKTWDRHDRISAISAVTISPRRRRLGLYVRLLPEGANAHGEDTVAFMPQVRDHIRGPMTILWDRAQIHDRSRAVKAYLAEHPEMRHRAAAHSPETNPDENVWQHTKHARLANFAPGDTAGTATSDDRGIRPAAWTARFVGGVHQACKNSSPTAETVWLTMLELVGMAFPDARVSQPESWPTSFVGHTLSKSDQLDTVREESRPAQKKALIRNA